MTTIDNFLPLFSNADAVTNQEPVNLYRSDYELAQKAAQGDMEAFERIYWQNQQRVYSVCYRMSKNVAEAEDMTQLVFIQLFRKIGSFRGNSTFTTWLHRLTVNVVLMQFRKKRVFREETTADGTLPESVGLNGTIPNGNQILNSYVLNEAIGRLPKGYRKMLILHDICGYEHQEIARMLDCSSGTSKSQLFKARQKLRKLLSNDTGKARP